MVVNIKNIKISLSEKDLDGLISKLNMLKTGLKEADNQIVKEMAKNVEDMVANNINQTPYKDGNDESVAYSEINGNKAVAGMKGSQCVYLEFGTGTEGASAPHPEKNKHSLKGYNTGKTIRPNKKDTSTASALGIKANGLYWTYMDNGIKMYTQGIPAGKQVFKAVNDLNKIKLKIIKDKVGEVISKL